MVAVGAALQCFGHKTVSWNCAHCLEYFWIADFIMVAESLNHPLPGNGVVLTSAGGLLTGGLHEG
jgi:hypothetical protein